MKKLAVCITTHITGHGGDAGRHGPEFRIKLFEYYQNMIQRYIDLDSGLKESEWDLYIMDTDSTAEFKEWAKQVEIDNKNIYHIGIANYCGFAAGLKHAMHEMRKLRIGYEHLFFHVDDGVEPVENGWAVDLIDSYTRKCALGIMGRELITIDLGPNGLVEHHNWCKHISKMWNIAEVTTIPHLHADWWFMNKETLNKLADVWYDPQHSTQGMEYQRKWENTEFTHLQDLRDNRRTLDNIHVGREVDTALRIELFNGTLCEYAGTKINALQIHHRGCEI